VRWIKAIIVEEDVVFVTSALFGSNIQSDFASFNSHLQPKEPCYIMFRLEDAAGTSSNVQRWVWITYCPDVAQIRSKMLIASTRELAKKQLGLNYFWKEMGAALPSEVSWEHLQSIVVRKEADDALTVTEVALRSEATAEVHHGVSREYVHSVQFPVDKQVFAALEKLKSGRVTFIQLLVDPEKETIDLGKSGSISVDDLTREVSSDTPTFTLFRWKHEHDEVNEEAYLFIYCCPQDSKVRLKMLFSTVAKAALSAIESAGITVTKKVEVEDPSELTEENLRQELHPQAAERPTQNSGGQKFAKPARPGRGRARITKS